MSLIHKKIDKEFHVCEKCGYEKGFHVSFIKQEESHEVVSYARTAASDTK